MDYEQLLIKIMDETIIMKSALEAKDFEIANSAIDRRDQLIHQLQQVENRAKHQDEIQVFFNQLKPINDECEVLLEALKEDLLDDFYESKVTKKKAHETKLASGKYTLYGNTVTGTRFDKQK